MALLRAGLSEHAASRQTGVPRSTVHYWRHHPPDRRPDRRALLNWKPPEESAYCYLLGLYLGDGHVVARQASGSVCLFLDEAHPGIIQEARAALAATFPGARVGEYDRGRERRIILQVNCHAVIPAFPQHGRGKKHERRIVLADWQTRLCRAHPRDLLRGLIHSDGCRTINRFKTKLPSGRVAEYEYPRYFFSNLSADIRGIFCDHCEMLGIRWTQSNHRNISISDRRSVELMDRYVGPKE